jgi:hypothetical protein
MPITLKSDCSVLCTESVLRKNSFGAKSFLRQKASKMASLQKKFLPVPLLCVAQNSESQSLLRFYEIAEVTSSFIDFYKKRDCLFERQSLFLWFLYYAFGRDLLNLTVFTVAPLLLNRRIMYKPSGKSLTVYFNPSVAL